jgi:hypothetical protein
MSWGSDVAVLFCSIFLLFVFKRLLVKLRNTGSQENSKRSCTNLMVVLGSGGFHRVVCGFYYMNIVAEFVGHFQHIFVYFF